MRGFWIFYRLLAAILLSSYLCLVVATTSAAAPGLVQADRSVRFDIKEGALDPNAVLELVNERRQTYDVDQLLPHVELGRIAQARADDMAARQYYAHKNPDGYYYYTELEKRGIPAGYSCENLDLVFAPNLDRVVYEWQSSLKGHKECMLHDSVTIAGYGSSKLTLVNANGTETTAYVVVAIHAQLPQR